MSNSKKLHWQQKKQYAGAIEKHKNECPKEIQKINKAIGRLLYKRYEIDNLLNREATMLKVYEERLAALETVTPETFMDYTDKHYTAWNSVEFDKSILNMDIILGFLQEAISPEQYLLVVSILKGGIND